ncbi:hypothetical protein AYI69_g7520, partial [Smittium culicis]
MYISHEPKLEKKKQSHGKLKKKRGRGSFFFKRIFLRIDILACTASSRSFSAFAFFVSAIRERVASFFLSLSAFSSNRRFFVSL